MRFRMYEERDAAVRSLGFKDYADYLESPLWKEIRGRVLLRDAAKCYLCDKDAKAVHHNDYSSETLEGKADHYLYSLCHGCHRRVEFDSTNPKRKLSPKSVFAKLVRLRSAKGKPSKSKPWIGLKHRDKWQRRYRKR